MLKLEKKALLIPMLVFIAYTMKTNEKGQRLFGFATLQNMIIANRAFPHKEIHKYA